MNLLFYVEPLIELQKPYWKQGWVNETCLNIVRTLYKANSDYYFELITNEAIAQTIAQTKEFTIHTVSQEELLKPFDTNYLSATKSWHMQTYTKEQLAYYENLMLLKLANFVPDVIITFTPVPFLQTLFPNALILHHELSIFSRLPYPMSWFFDPVGVSGNSFLNRFGKEIADKKLSIEQQKKVSDFKYLCQSTLRERSPFGTLLAKKRENFDALVLLPLQFSGYYLFDDLVSFKSQYEYCVYVLDTTPHSIGVVVNMHPEYPALNDEALKFLASKYPHFICLSDFNTIYASGQFILPFVDGVITVSSSIGLQALLFDKKVINLGGSCFGYMADAFSLDTIASTLTHSPKNNDTILYYMLTHYAITSHYLHDPLWLDTFLKHSLHRFRTNGVDAHFYNPIDSDDTLFNNLSLSLMKNADTVPQYTNTPIIQLFFDFGTGIDDKKFLTTAVSITDKDTQTFIFDIADSFSLQSLRLDPLNNNCVIDLESLVLRNNNNEEIDISDQIYSNACLTEGKTYFFELNDPQIFFIPKEKVLLHTAQKLIVTIRYVHNGQDALQNILHHQIDITAAKEREISSLHCILGETSHLLQHFQDEYSTLLQSKSWRMTAPLRAIMMFFKKVLNK